MTSLSHYFPPTAISDDSVAVTVPARSAEVAGVRRAVCALAARAGVPDERRADVALAVGEACANAVVHAYAHTEPGVLRVTAHVSGQGLEVTIADDGRGMAPRPDSPGLGLGLPLMASLTSALEFRTTSSGGTAIWMLFEVAAERRATAWAQTG